jgi:hypothetical protein
LTWNQQGAQGIQGRQGIQGVKGVKGDPGSITGQLPSGATETGAFVARGLYDVPGRSIVDVALSFSLFLSASVPSYYVYPGGPDTPCRGSLSDPEAAPGTLCVYQGVSSNLASVFLVDPVTTTTTDVQTPPGTAAVFGEIVRAYGVNPGGFSVYGSWAVMAP